MDQETDAEHAGESQICPVFPSPGAYSFTYVLGPVNQIDKLKVLSPWHIFGGFLWRLLIFPQGNYTDHDMSMYLECGGPAERFQSVATEDSSCLVSRGSHEESEFGNSSPLTGWRCRALFWLHLVHPSNISSMTSTGLSEQETADNLASNYVQSMYRTLAPFREKLGIVKEATHVFEESDNDWGFLEFAPLAKLTPGAFADKDFNIVLKAHFIILPFLPSSEDGDQAESTSN